MRKLNFLKKKKLSEKIKERGKYTRPIKTFIGGIVTFVFLVLAAIIAFFFRNLWFICLVALCLYSYYLLHMEFGRALATALTAIIFLLGVIANEISSVVAAISSLIGDDKNEKDF